MTEEVLSSPIGDLRINESDDGEVFAQGRYVASGNPVFFSIKLPARDRLEEVDFEFIRLRIAGVKAYTDMARDFLISELGLDPEGEGKAPLIADPEFTFWGGLDWSILFAEGSLDICEPYGVLVNFHDVRIMGFDDLSGAEESIHLKELKT
ncbi:hypothetical protein YDYSG_05430 [Paenibacillus tyrfis]|uniref:hypothetical protein n=1 Tax=Paenibacillus tyrfis TaxID=1501230 RepID=UPI0024902366|nr:hypothetical protein [Paenibacillus tyrfis]GLI04513.1 hypothetical protein YDYSG_05430 [Paenibacillus tyrfis]